MVRIVHIGAEAGMRLEPPAAGKINGTRADVVDRGAAIIFDCNLLARRGSGNSGFRRRVGEPDPSGAPSRKISGWMVPNTDTRGPGSPASAGPAPADFRTYPRSSAAIPSGIARIPQ